MFLVNGEPLEAKSSGRKNMWFRSARRRGTMMRCGEAQRLFQKEGFDFFQFQQLFEATAPMDQGYNPSRTGGGVPEGDPAWPWLRSREAHTLLDHGTSSNEALFGGPMVEQTRAMPDPLPGPHLLSLRGYTPGPSGQWLLVEATVLALLPLGVSPSLRSGSLPSLTPGFERGFLTDGMDLFLGLQSKPLAPLESVHLPPVLDPGWLLVEAIPWASLLGVTPGPPVPTLTTPTSDVRGQKELGECSRIQCRQLSNRILSSDAAQKETEKQNWLPLATHAMKDVASRCPFFV
ncbi:unnamed protein product [Cyprideis torosa]|uniref:Uncharacterized protein n=1 Tax=Cyprideis torosa TaxID=163714 RepID=A0A7R8WBE7_9CRUS|nr:unnamed protein product [Cyprideis torosa]CAG0890801.1 unnamed protein product [Cyprideis torosa]